MQGIDQFSVTRWEVTHMAGSTTEDSISVEEPLEIRLVFFDNGKRKTKSISITMRTPGDDEKLALGFLYTEGIITSSFQVAHTRQKEPIKGEKGCSNSIDIEMTENAAVDLSKIERHFYTSSSCGVCGKASIHAVYQQSKYEISGKMKIQAGILLDLPGKLRSCQKIFDLTGGVHAAGIFDSQGTLLALYEDVGRHNAVDKVIGHFLEKDRLPLSEYILQVSGRVSFELVQKAYMAGIPVLSAVGAPSSLAIKLAQKANMTIAGFAGENKFNIYTHPEKIEC